MTELFTTIVEMSIKAIPVICVLFLLRLALKKTPKKYSYALWAVAAFRLLCPVSVSSVFSLFNFRVDKVPSMDVSGEPQPTMPAPSDITVTPVVPEQQITLPVIEQTVTPSVTEPAVTTPGMDWELLLSAVWIVGVCAVLAYTIWRCWRLYRRTDGAVRENGVWVTDNIPGPFVFGLVRPKIFVPTWLGEKEREYVLAHERYHIKRLDPWAKALCQIILALHWFNPMVWLMLWAVDRDMEMSCDEGALKHYDEEGRKNYSRTLLALSTGRKEFGPVLAFGTPAVKRRIVNVLNFKKGTKLTVLLGLIVLLVAALTCCTDAKQEENLSYAERLYEAKTQYVGDNSAVANLTNVVLSEAGFAYDSIELDTDAEPYGMTVYLSLQDGSMMEEGDAFRSAVLLLTLVDNLSWCDIDILCNSVNYSLTVTVEQAEFYLDVDDLKGYSADAGELERLLALLAEMDTERISYKKTGMVTAETLAGRTFTVASDRVEWFSPFVSFNTDGSYHICFSGFSSIYHRGIYLVEGDRVILQEDSGEKFTFRIVNENTLSFIADESATPERFEDAFMVVDGTVFYASGEADQFLALRTSSLTNEAELQALVEYAIGDGGEYLVEAYVGDPTYGVVVSRVISETQRGPWDEAAMLRTAMLLLALVDDVQVCHFDYAVKSNDPTDSYSYYNMEKTSYSLYYMQQALGVGDLKQYASTASGIYQLLEGVDALLQNDFTAIESYFNSEYAGENETYIFAGEDENAFWQPFVRLYEDGTYYAVFSLLSSNINSGYYVLQDGVLTLMERGGEAVYYFERVDEQPLAFMADGSFDLGQSATEEPIVDGSKFSYDLLASRYGTQAGHLVNWDDFSGEESYLHLFDTLSNYLFEVISVDLRGSILSVNATLPADVTETEARDQLYRAGAMLLALSDELERVHLIAQSSNSGEFRSAYRLLDRETVERDLDVSDLSACTRSKEALEAFAERIEEWLRNTVYVGTASSDYGFEQSSGTNLLVTGLDAEYVEYVTVNTGSTTDFLYFVHPAFLGDWFEGKQIEGSANWVDEACTTLKFGFTMADPDVVSEGTVTGPGVSYVVSVLDGQILEVNLDQEGYTAQIDMTEAEVIEAASKLAGIMWDAKALVSD